MIGGLVQKTLMDRLSVYPVFTVRDIASLLNKSRAYAYLVAYRLKKKKILYEIEKGKYTFEEDPFMIASWVIWPSYISCWAALQYYKLTEQLPFTIHVMTTRKRKKKIIVYGNAKIEFIKIKADSFGGFQRLMYHTKEIFIAEKEKAIIDALAAKKMSLSEAHDILKNNRRMISKRRLFAYARHIRGLTSRLKVMFHD